MKEFSKPVRILHVVTYMGRGGLETMLMNYYRNIDRNLVQFDFLTHRSFQADYDQEIEQLGGRIYHLPRLNPFSPVYLRSLDCFFKEHREYKIVHSHLDCMAGIPLKYAKKNGVPVRIAHAHSSSQVKDSKYFLKILFKQGIRENADYLFACSKKAGEWMFETDRFQILNNAIDTDQYVFNRDIRVKVRKDFGIKDTDFVVGHVGSFSPPKNHRFLIDVFDDIVKKYPESILLLAGDGKLKKEIEEYCRTKGLEKKVIFAGLRDDVPELLQAMDLFLFPSLFEGLPMAVIEAQAAGLPCLISDRVPIECKKTKQLVRQLKLEAGTEKWSEEAVRYIGYIRKNTKMEIENADFDIKKNAVRLQKFYLDIVNKGK